jgi:hypothetical protein
MPFFGYVLLRSNISNINTDHADRCSTPMPAVCATAALRRLIFAHRRIAPPNWRVGAEAANLTRLQSLHPPAKPVCRCVSREHTAEETGALL